MTSSTLPTPIDSATQQPQDDPPAAEAADDEPKVRLGLYLRYIKKELDNESACLELPFTFILLLAFSGVAYLHLKQADVLTVESAVTFDIENNANFAWNKHFGHKVIHDVNSIADFWSFFRIGFLPLIVQHDWTYSMSQQVSYDMSKPADMAAPFDAATLPLSWALDSTRSLPVRDDYLHYNRIIGGFRMRQERSQSGWEYCHVPGNVPEDLWKYWLGKPCLSKNPNYELPPQITEAETFAESHREEWLISALDGLQELQRKVVDMEDGCSYLTEKMSTSAPGDPPNGGDGTCKCTTCSEGTGVVGPWLDELTERVQVGFIMYNFEYGLYSYVTCDWFFNRGGKIHKMIHVQSSWASLFTGTFWEVAVMLACDFIWLLALTYILVGEIKEVIRTVHSSKERWYSTLWNDYVGFWNVVDWLSIMVAYFVVACWAVMYASTSKVNQHFQDLASVDLASIVGPEAKAKYTQDVAAFFDATDGMVNSEHLYRLSFMFYPMGVMLRLFKSFDAQPRLAVVTRTIMLSAPDMLHFFVIFFSCYFCLAVNGVFIFGQDFVEFSTMFRSIISSFRVLFGKWDYDEMEKVGIFFTIFWFWTYMLVLFMLLLNILLAILMEAYGEVQEKSEKLSLGMQVSELIRRYRQTKRGDRVRLNEIWDAYFKAIGDEKDMIVWEPGPGFPDGQGGRQFVTPMKVQAHVRKMLQLQVPLSQAKRGLTNAHKLEEEKDQVEYTVSRVNYDLDRLNTLTKDCRDQVHRTIDIMMQYDNEEDEEFARKIPDAIGEEFTEQRQLVADAVRGAVGQLTAEISATLAKEAGLLEKRQKALEMSQAEMVVCARDATSHLAHLRERTDEVVKTLQHLVLAKQRSELGGAISASGLAAAVMGAFGGAAARCGTPARGTASSV